MTAARYWRFRFKTTQGSATWLYVPEMEFRQTPGGADECVAGQSQASSQYSGSYAANLAVDNNLGTQWCPAANTVDGAWIDNDVGSGGINVKEILEAAISIPANYGSLAYLPRSGTIDYSEDRVNWIAHTPFTLTAWTSAAETKTITMGSAPAPNIPNDAQIYGAQAEVWNTGSADTPAQIYGAQAEVWATVAGTLPPVPEGAHRYWRMLISANAAGSYAAMSAFAAFESADGSGTNALTLSTPAASTVYNGQQPSVLLDGDANTWWATSGGVANEWVRFDLGAGGEKKLDSFSYSARNDAYSNQAPTSGQWQYSDDAVAWTTAFSFNTTDPFSAGETQTFLAPPPAGASRRRRAVVC